MSVLLRWLDRLGRWFERLVQRIKAIYDPLADMRITILALVLGGSVLLLNDAGLDVVRQLVDTAAVDAESSSRTSDYVLPFVQWPAFLLACIWTGVNAWYWAHLLYKSKPHQHGDDPTWFVWFRRGLGELPLLCALIAMPLSRYGGPGNSTVTVVAMTVFFASGSLLMGFFVARDGITRSLVARSSALTAPADLPFFDIAPGRLVRGDLWFIASTVVVSIIAFVMLWIPVVRTEWAWVMGPAALTFGAIGCVVPITSLLILALRRFSLPFILLGVLAFLVFSLTNDNHAVRALSDSGPPRGDVDVALARWSATHTDPSDPLVLVATAGGASRAAYWTGTVLRALDDKTDGTFSDHVFAISSVSGGTLGAIGYAAWLADRTLPPKDTDSAKKERLRFVQDFFGEDYLGPAIGGMLYVDLIQRFLPVGFLPDRAESLEEAFEKGWDRSVGDCGETTCPAKPSRFAQDFTSLWSNAALARDGGRWVPIVLANGTHVETGKRIITAPVKIGSDVFEDAYDFYDLNPKAIRASTAVLNSARFTLVSPAGRLMKDARTTSGGIIDGGYFENGGLETLYDLARHIKSKQATRKIIIIEIVNDDTMDPDDLARHDGDDGPLGVAKPPAAKWYSPLASELTSILYGLYETRSARGTLGAKRLSLPAASGLSSDAMYVSFPLPAFGRRGQWHTAMSWALSLASRSVMDHVFDPWPHEQNPSKAVKHNRDTRDQVACAIDRKFCE